MEKHECNPNTIIYGRGIAPIHYACGMENENIADEITELMLKYGGEFVDNDVYSWYGHLDCLLPLGIKINMLGDYAY